MTRRTNQSRKAQQHTSSSGGNAFEQQAEAGQVGLLREFADFLLHNKKWWLTPIVLVLLLVSLLVVLGGTAAAPFIYTLF
jgi:hypothetical protein